MGGGGGLEPISRLSPLREGWVGGWVGGGGVGANFWAVLAERGTGGCGGWLEPIFQQPDLL